MMNENKPQVMLVQYRNERYEPAYAYIRMEGDKAAMLKQAANGEGFAEPGQEQKFRASNLGRVVASGRGEPSEDLRELIAARYDCFCRYALEGAKRRATA